MLNLPDWRPVISFHLLATVAVVAGCQRESPALQPLAEVAYADLARNSSLRFELADFELADPDGGALLVRVEGFEAALESTITGPGGEKQSMARLPYIRVGPVFHVVSPGPEDEPAYVTIRPEGITRDARISLMVLQLPTGSRRDAARIEAYLAYEAATQSTTDESVNLWRERAELLRMAASGFKRTGDTQEQLWAKYLEAYAHYFPLAEYDRAAEMAEDIQERAQEHGFREIGLLAAQLEGQALIERNEGDTLEAAQKKASRGQAVLQRAVSLAAEMGYRFEQAWALNSRGIGYFYQGRHDEAEQHYERALAIALDLQDSSLQTQVRGNLALVRERQGDLYGALAELQALNAQLREAGISADLAHNWSELSRLYERLYLFPESIEAQRHALEIWRALNSAEGKGRSGLSLAHSYQAMGNPQMASAVLTEGIADMEAAGFSRGLRDGFGLLAQLYRGQAQYDRMSEARERQGDFLSSHAQQARFRYEKGLDALAQYPDDPGRAEGWFQEAEGVARAAGEGGLEARAQLQRCAIEARPEEACNPSSLKITLDRMLPAAPPSQAIEARFLYAQNLVRADEFEEAWKVVDALVVDIQLYRHTLPGVLGAWYWEGRARIFDFYMGLWLKESDDPAHSLLAFNRLLNTSLGSASHRTAQDDEANASTIADLRGLLAQLEQRDSESAQDVRQAIDRRLLQLRTQAQGVQDPLNAQELSAMLADLPSDTGLLAYYLTPADTWAWLASRERTQVIRLENGQEIAAVLGRIRTGLRVVGDTQLKEDLNRLGDLLLAPLGRDLPETIYLLAAGPLAGFPFEAIGKGDRYLGQGHFVINVLSLEALGRPAQSGGNAGAWQEVLLAGDPLQPGDGLLALPAVSRELDGLDSLLAGRSIHRARGEQLNVGLFREPAFESTDVIHIASHAEINLEYPELSRLLVSPKGGEAAFLTPLDLHGVSIAADLVVLSACETSGVNAWTFDSNLGFVSAFLQSGAGAVVATLWPVPDAFVAEFVLDFYAAMLAGATPPAALAQVKRRYMAEGAASGKLAWPAFQIYIN